MCVSCEGHAGVLSRIKLSGPEGLGSKYQISRSFWPRGTSVLRMSFDEGVAVGGGVRMPSFNGSRETWPSWKLSFQAIVRLDDRLNSDILEPWRRGKDFMPEDVGEEPRTQERHRSLLVLSCNVHEGGASFLVNNAPVGRVQDGVFAGAAAGALSLIVTSPRVLRAP